MEEFMNLKTEELKILISDCENDLNQYKSRLVSIMMEKDSIKRKIKQLEAEKELLEIIKSGSNFSKYLVDPNPATISTLQFRYAKIS